MKANAKYSTLIYFQFRLSAEVALCPVHLQTTRLTSEAWTSGLVEFCAFFSSKY